MHSWSNNLFYLVFLCQIILMSYYYPQKLLSRMRAVMENYPPTAYPKLYPRPVEYYRMGQLAYKYVNWAILLLGLVVLYAVMFLVDHSTFADDGYISVAWPAAYGMIQFIPVIVIELAEFSQFKRMRSANKVATRRAELRPRRLLDFVSPRLVVAALVLDAITIFFDLYIHDFVIDFGHDTMQRVLVLTITNLFLAAIACWQLYGQKRDPHQSFDDRAVQLSAMLKSSFFVSMTMSVFFITLAADDVYEFDYLNATLISLYFQTVVVLSLGHVIRSLKIENIDFEVYRADPLLP